MFCEYRETYQINTNIANYHENPDKLGADLKDSC